MEHLKILDLPEHYVRLYQILVVGVDRCANPRLLLGPGASYNVDVATHESHRAPTAPQGYEGTLGDELEGLVSRQPAEGAELQQQRACTGRGRHGRLPLGHARLEIHGPIRQPCGGLEGGEQSLSEVNCAVQQRALVPLHQPQLRVRREQVGAEEPPEHPDVGLEDGDRNVCLEGELSVQVANSARKLCLVAQDREGAQRVDKGQGVAPKVVGPAATQWEQLVMRVRVLHVVVV
mmetsp:Transcript_23685/g.54511  ORF Transcript_23685/g.54511 Transcript_23685/m.54511 type:complete len:234 (+) Transcript_23685:599-1300(+)